MRCKFIRDVDVNPKSLSAENKAKLKFRNTKVGHKTTSVPYFPAGTVYEHPLAVLFVQKGSAVPDDDECRETCGMTEEQLRNAQHLYQREAAGIRPEDRQLFDDGVILGYEFETGEYVRGPAWDAYQQSRQVEQKKLVQSDI